MTPKIALRQRIPRLIVLVSFMVIFATGLGYLTSLHRIAGCAALFGIGLEFLLYFLHVRKGRQKSQ